MSGPPPTPMSLSIHAPREGVRPIVSSVACTYTSFQSTHPARGCDLLTVAGFEFFVLSIHAPREGVRLLGSTAQKPRPSFHSTHPARGCDLFSEVYGYKWSTFKPRTTRGGETSYI